MSTQFKFKTTISSSVMDNGVKYFESTFYICYSKFELIISL